MNVVSRRPFLTVWGGCARAQHADGTDISRRYRYGGAAWLEIRWWSGSRFP